MQLVHSSTTIADFNADLIQAQREALKALSEVMAESADPADDDNTRLDDDDLQTRAARFRRLSLRLRAATAILRVKPLVDAPPQATANSPSGAHASTHPRVSTPRATEHSRDISQAAQAAAATTQAPRDIAQPPRPTDSTPKRTSNLATISAPAAQTPFASDRT